MTTYSAVVTTGIYCRPGCRARPRAENVRTFELAASAEAAGFRACLLPPIPDGGPPRSGCPRARLPCGPADHRRRAGHRDRGGARGETRGLAPASAADLPWPAGHHSRPAGQVEACALRAAAARRHRPGRGRRGVRVGVRQPAPVQPADARGFPGRAQRPASPPEAGRPAGRGRRADDAAAVPAALRLGHDGGVLREPCGARRGVGVGRGVPQDDQPRWRSGRAGDPPGRIRSPAAPGPPAVLGGTDTRGGPGRPDGRDRCQSWRPGPRCMGPVRGSGTGRRGPGM